MAGTFYNCEIVLKGYVENPVSFSIVFQNIMAG